MGARTCSEFKIKDGVGMKKKTILKHLCVAGIATVLGVGFGLTTAYAEESSSPICIDETNFPDEGFRQYINDYIDPNKDGWLSQEEIESVTLIDCSYYDIVSMEGIKYFVNVTRI